MKKTIISFLTFLSLGITGFCQAPKHTFALGDEAFLLDGKPFQMISGEMHYPRVPREAWRARMKMAKAMGLNTIGTYVFWNLHEPQKGKFDFTGNNDVAEFVRIAQQEGLWVILAQAHTFVPSGSLEDILTGYRMKKVLKYAVKRLNILRSIKAILKRLASN
ncbi:hypothetical protein ABID99_001213 [Mucilaginibacter sp. OAE612]